MTNPDNVGGLRDAKSRIDLTVEALERGLRDEALLHAEMAQDSIGHILGELCRAASSDNVGGRDRLWDAILGEINLRTVKGAEGSDIETADRIRELCRAAPAGGDVSAHVMNLAYMRGGYSVGLPERNDALDAAIDSLRKDSAPAGSGEVEGLGDLLKIADELDTQPVFPSTQARALWYAGLSERIREAAALLRKLQQGAE